MSCINKKEGVEMPMKNEELRPGDIIFTDRFLYRHYGIYAGHDRVIHYSSRNGDFGNDVCVRETSMKRFVKGGSYQIAEFDAKQGKEKCFSREETVSRARSRIGKKGYNLLFNNCEHFALWCKTGVNKSDQVEKTLCAVLLLGAAVVVTGLLANSDEVG